MSNIIWDQKGKDTEIGPEAESMPSLEPSLKDGNVMGSQATEPLSNHPTFFADLNVFISELLRQKPRQYDVLRKRFGFDGGKCYTLDAIGSSYGITREMVRQDEQKAKTKIHKALFVTTEFRSEMSVDVQKLKETAQELCSFLNTKGNFITEDEIASQLFDGETFDSGILNMFFWLSGYEKLSDNIIGFSEEIRAAWINKSKDSSIRQPVLFAVTKILVRTLKGSHLPVSLFDFKGAIHKNLNRAISDDYIRFSVALCKSVETIRSEDSDPSFQLKFSCLGSLADKAYRVLVNDDQHTPLRLNILAREINHRMVVSGYKGGVQARSLQQQLVTDPRFTPIGRSGEWKLREWDEIATATIIEVMKEYFYLRNGKATFTCVLEYVLSKRPNASEKSVKTYISTDKSFVKVSKNEFELAEWGSKPFHRSKRTYRLKTPTKRERVQNLVLEYLSMQQHKSAAVEDVWKHVSNRIDCQKPTFYSYLSSMDIVHKRNTSTKSKICFLTA